MAKITTFSTLKTAVADWLDRSDMSTAGGPIDVMIGLMEAELYRDLRLRFMESAFSVTIASGVAALPADFLEAKYLYVDGTPTRPLQPKSAGWLFSQYPDRSSSGYPRYFAQSGDNLEFGPYPDSTYTIKGQYYATPTALGTSNETNYLTSNAPDLLLNGTLLQSIGYLGMDERYQFWRDAYQSAFNRLVEADQRERHPSEMSLTVAAM